MTDEQRSIVWCVYCGYEFEGTEENHIVMANKTKEHMENCEKHPLKAARHEINRLQNWVNDLQSNMCINCIYCGYRAGHQGEDVSANTLTQHVEECPKHPLKVARDRIVELEKRVEELERLMS